MSRRTNGQVFFLGFVCFMGPGLFNDLCGSGQISSTISTNSNGILYATFPFTAFFSGSINNVVGPRLTLLIGSSGYAVYIGSYLAINLDPDAGSFMIAAGAISGVCAGLPWTAQGSFMLAHPAEDQKGICFGIFWANGRVGE
ncbi:uncharacterized protein B0H18DRAFT_1005532 [Fomitopsis serialis]|uniref:uncharacterized protein n=1 Tax=Fomitopsis serialis TaxID=139415 RepID=UPI0020081B1C|nr:uncharacterized protein B0H18DRAFT_1005532 [Neoantrodia serialis]KAH9926779.1 hypothetical protein B0H18DRAFT_1005532 [Neoantrodia serialis]